MAINGFLSASHQDWFILENFITSWEDTEETALGVVDVNRLRRPVLLELLTLIAGAVDSRRDHAEDELSTRR